MAITYKRIFRPIVFFSSDIFATQCQGESTMALFKLCVLCLPMIGFFSFDTVLLAGESGV